MVGGQTYKTCENLRGDKIGTLRHPSIDGWKERRLYCPRPLAHLQSNLTARRTMDVGG